MKDNEFIVDNMLFKFENYSLLFDLDDKSIISKNKNEKNKNFCYCFESNINKITLSIYNSNYVFKSLCKHKNYIFIFDNTEFVAKVIYSDKKRITIEINNEQVFKALKKFDYITLNKELYKLKIINENQAFNMIDIYIKLPNFFKFILCNLCKHNNCKKFINMEESNEK